MTADPDDLVYEPTRSPAVVILPEQPKRLLPFCGECPPSQTRKRLKGKILQLLPFDLSVRPSVDGFWLCTTCPATYVTRPQLFGHVRFCEGQNVWACEWCGCRESETHHKANGPSGAKTLCSACSCRYRAGHDGVPTVNEKGEYGCETCGRSFPSINGLSGHRRFCDGGMWRCNWCQCTGEDLHASNSSKSAGPDGPSTLCQSCSTRWKSGHTGPPPTNDDGKYVCDQCSRVFDDIRGLGTHRARCDGGMWRCEWCERPSEECSGKGAGPNGASTLCAACSGRFRGGASGPPPKDGDGKYVCEDCSRSFDTISGLGCHKRLCDGGNWKCEWCNAEYSRSSGKGPGPNGAKTLCGACTARFRSGASGPPITNEQGKYVCEKCDRAFDTIAALGTHKRRCDGGKWRCGWCQVKWSQGTGKGPGPLGPGTLCANCSGRYRNGATGAVKRDDKGNFLCDCGRVFTTNAGLGGHRRSCQFSKGCGSALASSPTLIGTNIDGQAASPCNAGSPSPSPVLSVLGEPSPNGSLSPPGSFPAVERMPDPD